MAVKLIIRSIEFTFIGRYFQPIHPDSWVLSFLCQYFEIRFWRALEFGHLIWGSLDFLVQFRLKIKVKSSPRFLPTNFSQIPSLRNSRLTHLISSHLILTFHNRKTWCLHFLDLATKMSDSAEARFEVFNLQDGDRLHVVEICEPGEFENSYHVEIDAKNEELIEDVVPTEIEEFIEEEQVAIEPEKPLSPLPPNFQSPTPKSSNHHYPSRNRYRHTYFNIQHSTRNTNKPLQYQQLPRPSIHSNHI